jgi:hypothetical protein
MDIKTLYVFREVGRNPVLQHVKAGKKAGMGGNGGCFLRRLGLEWIDDERYLKPSSIYGCEEVAGYY